jgi:hypothetical protein
MEISFPVHRNFYIHITLIFSFICSPILVAAEKCREFSLCEEELFVEGADYELFEKFEEAFNQFEIESSVEDEDDSEDDKKGFLKKWKKKLKKWFTKKIYKIFKKITGIKKIRNGEQCAYSVAKFKRRIDKKLHHTGSVDKMFEKFDEHMDQPYYSKMNSFKERVRFYHENKKERPTENNKEANDKAQQDLKNIPIQAMIGGVGVSCGIIIMVIPFPGCSTLGKWIIGAGVEMIVYSLISDFSEEQEKMKEQENKQ